MIHFDSLKKQTILFTVFTTILCIAGSAMIVTQVIEKGMSDRYHTEKATSLAVLSYALSPMMELYDYKQVALLIQSFLNYENIASIAVLNKDGVQVRAVVLEDIVSKELDMETHAITTSLEGIIGNIQVGFSKAHIDRLNKRMIIALLFGLMGIFSLIGFGIYTLMERSVINRLKTLTNAIKDMTFENLSTRVTVKRTDEIGMLATSFNQMADRLETSHKALKESEERYRTIFENASEGILIVEIQTGKYKYSNPAFSELVGYSEEELRHLGAHDIHPGANIAYVTSEFKAQASGEKQLAREIPFLSKHGSIIYMDIMSARMSIDGADCLVGFCTDITERKKLEKQLAQAQKMEAIGTLAGGIAHDFNNLLSCIMGFTEISMLDVPEQSTLRKNLEEIFEAGERAKDLTQQILMFSRQAEQELKPVELRLIVKETLKLLESVFPKSIEIRQHIESHAKVLGDASQLNQVVMNLCTNAGHAMQEKGGLLEVWLEDETVEAAVSDKDIKPGSYLRLTVRDTGIGMTAEMLSQIFDPFFTTKKRGEGTGLGLSMAHSIVKSCGGMIDVASEPGRGSTFDVYLPVIEERIDDAKGTEAPIPTGSERILFIDDERSLAEIGKQIVEWLGYRVTTSIDSQEALDLFKSQPNRFDLVITDFSMPKLSGVELARKLKSLRSDVPIILCTGFISEESEQQAKESGIDAVVMKPISMQRMAHAIRRVLDEG